MRKLLMSAIAISALGIASAAAADLPVKTPILKKAPPPAPAANWQGFYVGGNAGYGWDPATAYFNPSNYVTTIMASFGGFVDTGPDGGPVSLSVKPKGWLGGGQFGYNWQQNSLVYGLEADIDWSGIKSSTSAPWFVNGTVGGDNAGVMGNVGLQQKLDYLGTVRGRLGWANDTLLLYGTGGLAWGRVATTFNTFGVTQTANLGFTPAELAALQTGGYASNTSTRVGYAVGAGFEWMVAHNWSVKAEYLYAQLQGSGGSLSIPGGTASTNGFSVQLARIGLNYFFRP
jgi:outer membrane immunogenic protein